MVKSLFAVGTILIASQAYGQEWQRPDCSAFTHFSECRNAEINDYRQRKQKEFQEQGLSFWYFERPDFSSSKEIKQAQESKIEGALYFSFTVGTDGRVSSVTLKHKTSDAVEVYAPPILSAIKNWQFIPSDISWPDQEWRFQFFYDPADDDQQDHRSLSYEREDVTGR